MIEPQKVRVRGAPACVPLKKVKNRVQRQTELFSCQSEC